MEIACVLKGGGEFKPVHLYALADSIIQHNPEAKIRCLTNVDIDHEHVEALPLQHNWPRWWSKIELFRPGNFPGPTLYLDLDTVVVGRIEIEIGRFTMLQDVYRKGDFGSGVMSWKKPPEHVYHAFAKDPQRHMLSYRTRNKWGDQAFIRDHLGEKPATFGQQFRSYKVHCKDGVPEDTRVVYFHGKPRPWQVSL